MFSKIGNLWRRSLQKRPVITNTIVYATFYTAAELSQQTFNKIYTVRTFYENRLATLGTKILPCCLGQVLVERKDPRNTGMTACRITCVPMVSLQGMSKQRGM